MRKAVLRKTRKQAKKKKKRITFPELPRHLLKMGERVS